MKILCIFLITVSFSVAGMAQQNLRPGAPAPDFAIESMDGKQYTLKQLQGRVVVLTFWSTRCSICVREIPKLNQVAAKYHGKDVVFLAMSTESKARIQPFLRKNPFRADIVPNSFGIVLKYADMDRSGNIDIGFPAYFIIDRKGQIKHRADGWNKTTILDSQISRLL